MKNDTIKECMNERLLRKIQPDMEKSRISLENARERLDNAKEAIEKGVIPYAIIEAYTCMFHAARAILYKDGIQEKSHWAIYVYLKEKHPKIPSHLLNIHRTERHETLYGLEYKPTIQEAQTAIKDAQKFLQQTQKTL
jgi:uncharacterized protein (UPF0332 family)